MLYGALKVIAGPFFEFTFSKIVKAPINNLNRKKVNGRISNKSSRHYSESKKTTRGLSQREKTSNDDIAGNGRP